MIEKIANIVWKVIERIVALPEGIFDIEDDENAIIEE